MPRILIGIFTLAALILMAQEKSQMALTNPDRVLTKQNVRFGGVHEGLTLYQRDLPKPTTAARLRYTLHTKPAAGADSNLAFYLVAIGERPADERIVWLAYETAPEFISPKPEFSAAIQPVVQSNSGTLWLVLAEVAGTDTVFRIYNVDLAKAIASVPFQLDPERKEEWPPSSQINSELRYTDAVGSGCSMSAIVFSSGNRRVLIHATREPKTCHPLEAVLDASSGHWSKVVAQSDSSHE